LATGSGSESERRGLLADALGERPWRIFQVARRGVDRERLVLGKARPLLGPDSRPPPGQLAAAGKRNHRSKRHGNDADPAANRGARRAQQLGERQRLRPGDVVTTGPSGRAVDRRQHRPGQVCDVDRLLQLAAATGHGQHERKAAGRETAPGPRQQREQPGQVPVTRRTVDHGRPQDRPLQRGRADRFFGGEPHRFRPGGERRGHRGGGDEHGPVEVRAGRCRDNPLRMTEPERRQVDQRVAARAREGRGEGGAVVEIAAQRRGTEIGHPPRRGRRAHQGDAFMPAACGLRQHEAAEEPATARDEQPHRRTAQAMSRTFRYSLASAARS
jgi:hypothetical protein